MQSQVDSTSMPAVLKYKAVEQRDITPCDFSADALCFLNKLRMMAMRCRSSANMDIFEACRLLLTDDAALADSYTDALLRTMRQGLDKSPTLYAPNSPDQSFDEAWLLRALYRAHENDLASLRFLIDSRIALPYRRSMTFLIQNVSEQISQV